MELVWEMWILIVLLSFPEMWRSSNNKWFLFTYTTGNKDPICLLSIFEASSSSIQIISVFLIYFFHFPKHGEIQRICVFFSANIRGKTYMCPLSFSETSSGAKNVRFCLTYIRGNKTFCFPSFIFWTIEYLKSYVFFLHLFYQGK